MSDRSDAERARTKSDPPKFAVGQIVRVKNSPSDDAVDSLGEVGGQEGEVIESAWFGFRSCWSYGIVVDGTEYAAVEYDLESA